LSKPELKPVDVADVYGNSQIKRTASRKDEVKKVRKMVIVKYIYIYKVHTAVYYTCCNIGSEQIIKASRVYV
jgi:hypothetical protein